MRVVAHGSVLRLEGSLRAPVSPELRERVEALLHLGERMILLDLARVPDLDAAGVGGLVHVYGMVSEAEGVLHVGRAPRRVRRLLDLAGVSELLIRIACSPPTKPCPLEHRSHP